MWGSVSEAVSACSSPSSHEQKPKQVETAEEEGQWKKDDNSSAVSLQEQHTSLCHNASLKYETRWRFEDGMKQEVFCPGMLVASTILIGLHPALWKCRDHHQSMATVKEQVYHSQTYASSLYPQQAGECLRPQPPAEPNILGSLF